MFKMEMKVRSIIINEHAPDKSQVSLYPVTPGNQPGDMQLWIPNDQMDGIKVGRGVTVNITPASEGSVG